MAADAPFWQFIVDKKGEWRGYFVARNGKTLFATSESYHNKSDCIHAAVVVESAVLEADSNMTLLERRVPAYDINGNPL